MSDVQSNVKPLTLTTGRVIFAIAGVYVTQSLVSALSMQSLPALVRACNFAFFSGLISAQFWAGRAQPKSPELGANLLV
ncbi:MFS transporter, partial [Escherichia coli]